MERAQIKLSQSLILRCHQPKAQQLIHQLSIRRALGITKTCPESFGFVQTEARVPLSPHHSGNFVGVSLDGTFRRYDVESMRPTFECELESLSYTLAPSPGGLGPYASLVAVGFGILELGQEKQWDSLLTMTLALQLISELQWDYALREMVKVWNSTTLELLAETPIPHNLPKSPPKRTPRPPSLEPTFYTRQRRSKKKVAPEPSIVNPPIKRRRPELSKQTLLSHHDRVYLKLPMRNLDPELGYECLQEGEGEQLGLPYAIVPPHPFVGPGECSWLLHGFRKHSSSKVTAIGVPFLKTTCCSLSPLDQ
ncbi:hypothetical protein L0F63_004462, partial [Massospora cicadina]